MDLAAIALATLQSTPRNPLLVLDATGRCVAEFGSIPAELIDQFGGAGSVVGRDVAAALGPWSGQACELIASVLAEHGEGLSAGVAMLPGGALEFDAHLWKLAGLPYVACQIERVGKAAIAHTELDANRSRFDALAGQAAAFVMEIDVAGVITFVGDHSRQWGVGHRELVGARVLDVVERWGPASATGTEGAVDAFRRFLGAQGPLDAYRIDVMDRFGRARSLIAAGDWYTTPSGDRRGLVLFRDAREPDPAPPTARARALHSLAGSMLDAVVELTPDQTIVAATPLPETWLGADRPIDGRSLAEFLHPEDVPRALRLREPAASFEPSLYRWRARDGGWRSIEARSVAYTPDGGEPRFILVGRDVTDELRSALEAREDAAADGNFSLAEGNLAVLAGGIAHDFNNLLTVSLGVTDLITEQLPLESPLRSQLAEVVTASRHAADLARQLLAITGRRKLSQAPCDLNGVIGGVSGLLRNAVPKSVRIDFAPCADPLWIEADAAQLRQVLLNLVTNAGEAIGPRTGVVEIRTHHFLGTPGDEATAFGVIEVRDDGPGMDDETRRRIFEPSFSTKKTGHGLGLAVVRSVIDRHQGWIVVDAAPERGTLFRIGFPLLPEGVVAAERRVQNTVLGHEAAVGGSVLIVDDDDAVRRVSAAMLRLANFTVVEAADAASMRATLAAGTRFDCAVVDLVMPDADGLALVDELRAAQPGIEIVICSGAVERLPESRADVDVIEKPFRYAQLIEAVWSCAERAQNRAQLAAQDS